MRDKAPPKGHSVAHRFEQGGKTCGAHTGSWRSSSPSRSSSRPWPWSSRWPDSAIWVDEGGVLDKAAFESEDLRLHRRRRLHDPRHQRDDDHPVARARPAGGLVLRQGARGREEWPRSCSARSSCRCPRIFGHESAYIGMLHGLKAFILFGSAVYAEAGLRSGTRRRGRRRPPPSLRDGGTSRRTCGRSSRSRRPWSSSCPWPGCGRPAGCRGRTRDGHGVRRRGGGPRVERPVTTETTRAPSASPTSSRTPTAPPTSWSS